MPLLSLKPSLAVIIVLPALIYFVALSTSLAAGTVVAALLLTASNLQSVLAAETSSKSPSSPGSVSPGALVLIVAGGIAAHAAVAWMFQPFEAGRAASSLVLLVLVLLGGCAFGRQLQATSDRQMDRALHFAFGCFLICALCGVLGWEPRTSMTSERPMFPFTEPSHFSLIFLPCFMYVCIRGSGANRYALWLLGFVVAGAMQSLTLLVGCAMTLLIFGRGFAVLLLVLVAGGAAYFADLSYYASRLDFTAENQNVSTLVFLQGWQLIGESLANSKGWGLGFQQLGLHGTDVSAAALIFSVQNTEQNLRDGGFNASKLISEFGVIGLALTILFVRLAWISFRKLRLSIDKCQMPCNALFAHCVVVAYVVECFLRGAGYFTSSGLLLVASFWLLSVRSKQAILDQGVPVLSAD